MSFTNPLFKNLSFVTARNAHIFAHDLAQWMKMEGLSNEKLVLQSRALLADSAEKVSTSLAEDVYAAVDRSKWTVNRSALQLVESGGSFKISLHRLPVYFTYEEIYSFKVFWYFPNRWDVKVGYKVNNEHQNDTTMSVHGVTRNIASRNVMNIFRHFDTNGFA